MTANGGGCTLEDVAARAGVSRATASRVINGSRRVAPPTRRAVEAAIAELGFHPHAGARALASSKTNVLALVAPLRVDVNVPVIMQFATAVVTAARSYNHDVLLLTKDEGTAGLLALDPHPDAKCSQFAHELTEERDLGFPNPCPAPR